jgi:xylulokinase
MLADLYACPVNTLRTDEGAALGVALLAGVGTGIFSSVEQACDAVIQIGTVQQPDMVMGKVYEPYFQLYKKLYTHLKGDFQSLYSIGD